MLIPLWVLGILVPICFIFVGLAAYYYNRTECLAIENQELHAKLAVLDSKRPNRDTLRAAEALFRELKVLLQPYTALGVEYVDNVHLVLFHRKGKRDLVRLAVNNSVTDGGMPVCIIHFLDSRESGSECVRSVSTTEVGAELMQFLSKFQRVNAAHQLQTLAYDRS